jgi:hypothetical protein
MFWQVARLPFCTQQSSAFSRFSPFMYFVAAGGWALLFCDVQCGVASVVFQRENQCIRYAAKRLVT